MAVKKEKKGKKENQSFQVLNRSCWNIEGVCESLEDPLVGLNINNLEHKDLKMVFSVMDWRPKTVSIDRSHFKEPRLSAGSVHPSGRKAH